MGEAVEVTGPAGAYVESKAWLSMGDVELDGSLKKGKCTWFDAKLGYGGIAMEGEEKEVMVHQSQIHAQGFRTLRRGEPVEFKLGMNKQNSQLLEAVEVSGLAGAYVKGGSGKGPAER